MIVLAALENDNVFSMLSFSPKANYRFPTCRNYHFPILIGTIIFIPPKANEPSFIAKRDLD